MAMAMAMVGDEGLRVVRRRMLDTLPKGVIEIWRREDGGERGVDVVRKEAGRTGQVSGRHSVAAQLGSGMAGLDATCFLDCLVTVERVSGHILKKLNRRFLDPIAL